MEKKEADFIDRHHCVNCGSTDLKELSGGLFGDAPVRTFIENDPWGENPMPYIAEKRWSYVQCTQCAQMFQRYVLSPAWNEVRFSNWMTKEALEEFEESLDWHTPINHFRTAKRHVSHILRLERMTQELRDSTAVRILDFGCGWGEFLAMCGLFGFIGYGIDRSSDRRQHGQPASIFPDIAELTNEIGPDNYFHVITLFEVLEHVDDPIAILNSLSKLLVTGGVLILETPDCTGITDIRDETSYRKIHPLDHINAFTSDTMRSIAKRAGFASYKPDISHVTTDKSRILKTEIKRLLYGFRDVSTQQYFRKISREP